jgi:outer membrane protein TolC
MIKSYKAKEQAAKYRKNQAVGAYLPKINFSQTYMRTDEPANAAFARMAQGQFDMTYFMTQLPDPEYTTNHTSKLQIVQPIFMNGKIFFGIKQAKEAYSASRFETERVKQFTLYNLHRAFYGLALAEKALDVVNASYDRTAKYYKTAKDFYDNGLIVKSDLMVSETYLLMNEQAVKEAEKQHAVAMSHLQRLIDSDESIEVVWTDPALTFEENLEKYTKEGLARRQDLQAMQKYSRVMKYESSKSKAAYLPSLSVFADHQINDEELFEDSGKGTTFGAQLNLNLFNGMSDYNKVQENKSRQYAMLHQIADKKLEIKSEIKNSFYGVIAASKKIEASKKRVEAAQTALTITENRFNEGLSKITELLDREVDLKQAELSLYMSEYELIVEKAGLHLASGILN